MENEPKKKPAWYTIREAAEYLDVKEPTIYRWMRENLSTFRKIGDSTRFWQEDLDGMMKIFPSPEHVGKVQKFCPSCHHDELGTGRVQGTGLLYFYPGKSKFWTLKTSHVETYASMCTRCGAVTWFGDSEKLKAIRQEKLTEEEGE